MKRPVFFICVILAAICNLCLSACKDSDEKVGEKVNKYIEKREFNKAYSLIESHFGGYGGGYVYRIGSDLGKTVMKTEISEYALEDNAGEMFPKILYVINAHPAAITNSDSTNENAMCYMVEYAINISTALEKHALADKLKSYYKQQYGREYGKENDD